MNWATSLRSSPTPTRTRRSFPPVCTPRTHTRVVRLLSCAALNSFHSIRRGRWWCVATAGDHCDVAAMRKGVISLSASASASERCLTLYFYLPCREWMERLSRDEVCGAFTPAEGHSEWQCDHCREEAYCSSACKDVAWTTFHQRLCPQRPHAEVSGMSITITTLSPTHLWFSRLARA